MKPTNSDTFCGSKDQVNGAIYDALQFALVALNQIDNDRTIFGHYFTLSDKANVKAVYQAVVGPCGTGNRILTGLTIRATDAIKNCGTDTLAYLDDPEADKPHITLCPPVYKKKAFTMIKGAKDPENDPVHYVRCQELQANGHMSYLMETMGASLLHEYMHYNKLVESFYPTMIDD
ncbi:MAG: hypothetical protein Q9209_007502 [Squamulea sp. 1 TL-2023]